ncbi:hypothetical protein [Actinocrispum wychmicini]|uniref:Uncharacterized protein n=1 Tax=Actinocrispum wychmicini TaxID=1213861 RepID=A0A4R2IZI1_9PSEU|nr:hypothetical protein [Actinocrispum wychmicini]TCO50757.1 hypothetical protein EV192_113137 [Actinocrispum wychmicini]
MTNLVMMYLLYIAISVGLTVWVGHTLGSNGRVFLIQVFDGNPELATAVNRLLIVGFYLVNLGFMAYFLRTDDTVAGVRDVFETLSLKVGTVVLVLGVLHISNVVVLARLRRRSLWERQDLPPVEPQARTTVT